MLVLAAAIQLPPPSLTARPASPTLSATTCGNLLPAGLLPPTGGFTLGCERRFSLKLGASIGPDGNYVLLDYPSCVTGACSGLTGIAGMQCHALTGYACCVTTAQVVPAIVGTNVGLFAAALSQRIAGDNDARPGICFADYNGNGARVLNVPLVTVQQANQTATITGFMQVFLASPPTGTGTSTTFLVEFVSTGATPALERSWGAVKTVYR
jgi:hypothetical protein